MLSNFGIDRNAFSRESPLPHCSRARHELNHSLFLSHTFTHTQRFSSVRQQTYSKVFLIYLAHSCQRSKSKCEHMSALQRADTTTLQNRLSSVLQGLQRLDSAHISTHTWHSNRFSVRVRVLTMLWPEKTSIKCPCQELFLTISPDCKISTRPYTGGQGEEHSEKEMTQKIPKREKI